MFTCTSCLPIDYFRFVCRNCFVEAMLTNGTLHKGMYDIMQEWYNYIDENIHIQADLIGTYELGVGVCSADLFTRRTVFGVAVYLRTTPEIVFERMKQRGRSEETSVSLDYLKQLHGLHENWLIHKKARSPAPVLVLNADLDIESINDEYARSEETILRPLTGKRNISVSTN